MESAKNFTVTCPLPVHDLERILLAHGGGGKRTRELIEEVFAPAFKSKASESSHDGAVLPVGQEKIAFTTDSYVVKPLFFPGGNIGSMAVYGTVNDLAMCGAIPLYLSAGFILEEGLLTETLDQVVDAMGEAARRVPVELVTGDTKVVDHGKGDGVFINTSGIGLIRHSLTIHPKAVQAGDRIILSGDLGRHGIAIMAQRESLSFETTIESDLAPVSDAVQALIASGIEIHCLRDLTRGGLSSALNEIASVCGHELAVDEKKIPVLESVRGACEILGLDPLYVANEGRFVVFVPANDADKALEVLRTQSVGCDAQDIGEVKRATRAFVTLLSAMGTRRVLDMLSGEQLPRIC